MSKTRLFDILAVVISIAPFIFFITVRDSLPDRMPIHWDATGVANRWTDKNQVPVYLGIMAALGMGMYFLLRLFKNLDPRKAAKLNERVAEKVGIGIVIFMATINIVILLPSTGSLNLTSIVFLMVSLLFTFLGNLMYNIKPNYFIGIRLPWTLEDEDNWRLTHRVAGIMWFIGGIVSAVLAILVEPKIMFRIFISITVVLVLVPSVYSFIIFRRTKSQSN